MSLADHVYTVRERCGGDWDHPQVKAWSDAVSAAERLIKERGAPQVM